MSSKRLERSAKNKVLAGVLGGLGEYLNIDPNILRIIAVILFILSPVAMVVLYLAAVFLLPRSGENKPLISSFKVSEHSPLILGFILFLVGAVLPGPYVVPVFWFFQPLLILSSVVAALLMLVGLILMASHLKKI
ncbi:MAG: PspC domain-containing protein [Thaumarchaeota archaeon]|nr:PspC domain-containing protein [Nitrososphaerota archaeon]